jgi:hypothetical protein
MVAKTFNYVKRREAAGSNSKFNHRPHGAHGKKEKRRRNLAKHKGKKRETLTTSVTELPKLHGQKKKTGKNESVRVCEVRG